MTEFKYLNEKKLLAMKDSGGYLSNEVLANLEIAHQLRRTADILEGMVKKK